VVAENYTNRAFFNQQWTLSMDRFPFFWNRNSIKNIEESYYPYSFYFQGLTLQLPKPRAVSVDLITYFDVAGVQLTLDPSNYYLDNSTEPARLIPANGAYWPSVEIYQPGAVKITYTCGSYGDGVTINTCPQNVFTAVALLTAHFYGNREGNQPIPDAFYRLLDSEKFVTFSYSSY
jgi:hypothetical protein